MAVKLSQQVESLEKEIEALKAQVKAERELGKKDALKYLSYKTKGFTDGTSKILQEHGISGPDSYALADNLWDMVKDLSSR